jgi:hypothetical protein
MKLHRKVRLTAALLVVAATPVAAFAGPKHGPNAAPAAGCSVSGTVVSATGLPTDQVVNFMVTTSSGTTGWVLGFTPDGTWSVNVPAPTGPTTYEFASRTYGPDGSKYNVFASCSV